MKTRSEPARSLPQSKRPANRHRLPTLPYGYEALEPYIDSQTMLLHHDKHHAGYVDQLNGALEKYPELQGRSASWLLLNLAKVPKEIRTTIRNNAGGHLNHSLFWRAMAPAGDDEPTGELADAIVRDFGSVEGLKKRFNKVGEQQFGSGWVWLTSTEAAGGTLQILGTAGHDTPLLHGSNPILVNDVWEHAYYLKHQNQRADYLHEWWAVTNWVEACRRFEGYDCPEVENWEDEGGRPLVADTSSDRNSR